MPARYILAINLGSFCTELSSQGWLKVASVAVSVDIVPIDVVLYTLADLAIIAGFAQTCLIAHHS